MQLRKLRTPQREAFPLKNYLCQQTVFYPFENVNFLSYQVTTKSSW